MSPFVKIISRYSLLWVIILFLSLPFLAFPEIVFGQQTLFVTDLSWIHFPRHIFAAEEWLAGRVPLWDPYENIGTPLLAESQVGVLYPLSTLFLSPLSPALELSLFILGHFTLAAFFTFILARSLKVSRAAATVAGLTFGFGGFLMAQVPNLNIMTGAAWLPLILLSVIQVLRNRSWLAAMLAGIPVAMQIFTAQPQIVFYTLVTITGYGLYRLTADFFSSNNNSQGKNCHTVHTIGLLAMLVLSGLLLAAPQLLPTLELQQLSVRSQERSLDFLSENSLPPAMWLNLLLPSAFGNNVTGFKGGDPFQEDFIYLGLIPVTLVLLSWPQRHKRDIVFFFLLLLAGVILAMGRFTPAYEYVVQYLPGFSLFRIPSRWLVVVNLALAVLAGFGMETLLKKPVSRSVIIILLASWLFLGLALIMTWVFRLDLVNWSSHNLNDYHQRLATKFLDSGFRVVPLYRDRLLLGQVAGLTVPAFLLLANLIINAILFILYTTRRISTNVFATLTIVAISADLIAAGGTTINPTKPDRWWWQLSDGAQYVLENVGGNRVFPLGAGSEEATVSHLGQYFPSVYHVNSAGGHGSSLRVARYDTFLNEAHPLQAIQVISARYLLTLGQMGADAAATFPIAFSDNDSFVYENKQPLPRAFIVYQTVQTNSPTEALSYFQNRSLDPRRTVVIESESDIPAPTAIPPTNDSDAEIINENPQAVDIHVSPVSDGYLVLLDTYYPGWVATIDGQPTPIYRANYIGRAVYVPVGKHMVRFEYQPLSFKLGLGLSALMLAIMVVTAFLSLRGK